MIDSSLGEDTELSSTRRDLPSSFTEIIQGQEPFKRADMNGLNTLQNEPIEVEPISSSSSFGDQQQDQEQVYSTQAQPLSRLNLPIEQALEQSQSRRGSDCRPSLRPIPSLSNSSNEEQGDADQEEESLEQGWKLKLNKYLSRYLSGGEDLGSKNDIDDLLDRLPDKSLDQIENKRAAVIRMCLSILFVDFFVFQPIHFFVGHGPHKDNDYAHDRHLGLVGFALSTAVHLGMLAVFLVSLPRGPADYVKQLLLLQMAECFINQFCLYIMKEEGDSPIETAQEFVLNYVRSMIALVASQYLGCRRCKLVFLAIHEVFTVYSAILLGLATDNLGFVADHMIFDVCYTFSILQIAYLAVFTLFEESYTDGLRSAFSILQKQEESTAVLENVDQGVIAFEKSGEVKYCNKQALRVLGVAEWQWQRIKEQEADPEYVFHDVVSQPRFEIVSSEPLNSTTSSSSGEMSRSPLISRAFIGFASQTISPKRGNESKALSFLEVLSLLEKKYKEIVIKFEPLEVDEEGPLHTESQFKSPRLGSPSRTASLDKKKVEKYLKIKMNTFTFHEAEMEILSMADVTIDLKKSDLERELLSLINAAVSHELRTPLNLIINKNREMKDVAERLGGDAEEYRDQLYSGYSLLESASMLMLQQVESLSGFAQLKKGVFTKNVSTFDLRRTMAAIVGMFRCIADKKHQLIFAKIDKSVNSLISSDESRIKEVISTLVLNALKFTPRGGEVTISCEMVAGYPYETFLLRKNEPRETLRISVRDTGPGVTPEDRPKLFKPFGFMKSEEKQLSTKGVGLGLSMCQMIVKGLGGKIWYDTEYTSGAGFTFEVRTDKEGPKQNRIQNPCPSFRTFNLKQTNDKLQKRIMAVDDVVMNLDPILYFLQCSNLCPDTKSLVDVFDDGAPAVEGVRKGVDLYLKGRQGFVYSLILLDLQMPMDGFKTCRAIRRIYKAHKLPQPVILACTAHSEEAYISFAWNCDMEEVLLKPLKKEEFLTAINDYLRA